MSNSVGLRAWELGPFVGVRERQAALLRHKTSQGYLASVIRNGSWVDLEDSETRSYKPPRRKV